jgi:hypothetical protein
MSPGFWVSWGKHWSQILESKAGRESLRVDLMTISLYPKGIKFYRSSKMKEKTNEI